MIDGDRDEARQFVLRTAQENDVKFIRLWFADILGNLKGFVITVEELGDALLRPRRGGCPPSDIISRFYNWSATSASDWRGFQEVPELPQLVAKRSAVPRPL